MRKGPQKFDFSFEAGALTRFGGLVLLRSFCKSLHLRHFLQLHVRWPAYAHRDYHPADLFLAHLFAVVAGVGRVENTQALVHNGLLPSLLGLSEFPHRKTLREFLHRFDPVHLESLQQAHDRWRAQWMRALGLAYSAVVDADTTTLTVFGRQEQTAVGFNRQYRGHASYAPLISSEGRSELSLGLSLRSGQTHPARGAWTFLEAVLEKLPVSAAASRTRVRLDSSFYSDAIVSPLEKAGVGYAIVARQSGPLRRAMVQARFEEFAEGWEAATFEYGPFHWKRMHRYAVVRRPVNTPTETGQALFTFKNHVYHRAVIHDLPLRPERVWRFYAARGFQELLLREFKEGYGLAKIPTQRYVANAVYMELLLWAYDLVLGFGQMCLPQEVQHWNMTTLRRELWWLPAEWVRRHNRNTLRLPRQYPRQKLFEQIERATRRIPPLR